MGVVVPGTAFWRFDVATGTLLPSDNCRALHGLASDAPFSFSDYLASIHPDDRAAHRQALDDAINKTGRFDVTYRILWPDGSVHRVHALGTVSPVPPIEIVGASIEVTD